MEFVKKNALGILICLVIAVPAWLLGQRFEVVGGPVFAILIGMVIALFWKDQKSAKSGITYTSKKVLQLAVVLLGFGMNLSQCHDADLAEELTQETFYQAVRSIDRFNGSCKVSVWLCQIAKHLWYQHLRKRKPEEPLPEDGLPGPSAEEDVLTRQGHLDLLRQIHALPPSTREVVYLRAFGGLSFREIGDVLGRTETWARVTFYRGKEALRKGGADHEEHS